MPGPPPEDRDEQRDAVRIDPARGPPRRPDRARRDERLDLDEDRPAALECRRDDAAGRRLVVLREERPGRVGHLRHAGLAHLEDPDLLGRTEPVLRGANESERCVALAFQGEDRVDEMLERLRPGQRAVLRDVADEDDRDPLPFRQLHQPERRFADLADAPGRPLELADGRGLDGVDDDELRPLVPGDLGDPPDLRLGDDPDPVAAGAVEQAEPGGPQPDLGGGLLAGRVQDRGAGRGDARGGLEQERRLADPRFATDQHDGALDEPAAEDAIELADPDRAARDVRLRDGPKRGRLGEAAGGR